MVSKNKKPLPPRDKSTAYKGYLIVHNLIDDRLYVSKDGFHIGSFDTLEKAKKDIDLITNPRPKRSNPGKPYRVKLIYGRVLRVEAQKIGPHRCDPGCKKADHRYYHDFAKDSNVHAYGMSDGSVLLIGSKKLWGMF